MAKKEKTKAAAAKKKKEAAAAAAAAAATTATVAEAPASAAKEPTDADGDAATAEPDKKKYKMDAGLIASQMHLNHERSIQQYLFRAPSVAKGGPGTKAPPPSHAARRSCDESPSVTRPRGAAAMNRMRRCRHGPP